MPAVKRSSGEVSDDEGDLKRSSEYTPSEGEGTKAKRKKGKKSLKKPSGAKRARKGWTEEEEAIYVELATRILLAEMWKAVKEDGRLDHRTASGVYEHTKAVMKKLKP